jgi:hypothetical protein
MEAVLLIIAGFVFLLRRSLAIFGPTLITIQIAPLIPLAVDIGVLSLITYALGSLIFTWKFGSDQWREGGGDSDWFRSLLVWNWLRNYFAFEVDTREPIKIRDEEKVVFVIYPHGYLPIATVFGFAIYGNPPKFPLAKQLRSVIAVTQWIFTIPLIRNIAAWVGCVDATKDVIVKNLRIGRGVVLMPGGIREMALNGLEWAVYVEHQGFAKIVVEEKASVIPIYAEGEHDIWITWRPFPRLLKYFINKWRLCFPILFFPFPFPSRVTVRIGKLLRAEDHKDAEDLMESVKLELKILTNDKVKFIDRSYFE